MTPTQLAVAAVLSALYVPGDELTQSGMPSFQEATILTRVAYNEARGKDATCMRLVVQTVMNRHGIGNQSVIAVATEPNQFAAHTPRVENIIDNRAMIEAAEAAVFTYSGLVKVPDKFRNTTHFHADTIPKPKNWGRNIVPVGRHCGMIFYVEMAK